jgi:hypothetical protein
VFVDDDDEAADNGGTSNGGRPTSGDWNACIPVVAGERVEDAERELVRTGRAMVRVVLK